MELSKAPRLMPFTAWGCGCVATSVLEGGKGAAGGGGGSGGGGGNVEIPVERKRTVSITFKSLACMLSLSPGQNRFETARVPSEGEDASTEQER